MGFFSLSKKNFSLNGRKKYVTLTIENKENKKQEENKHIDNNPTGLWIKCPECQEILYKEDIENNLKECPKCNHYFEMTARERIDLLIDNGSFVEEDANLFSQNPLDFPQYEEKNKKAQIECEMNEGVISGVGNINGIISGGIVGYIYAHTECTNIFTNGNITGETIGGIIGAALWDDKNNNKFENCYFLKSDTVQKSAGSKITVNASMLDNLTDTTINELNSYISNNSSLTYEWKKWTLGSDGYPVFV